MTPFITASQLLDRFDWRYISKNILDGPTSSTSDTPPTKAQLLNDTTEAGARLVVLITDASEELMAAAAVGARYTEDELRTYGGNLLISIVAGLAIGPILERRQRATEDMTQLSSSYKRAVERVEELRRGERIFFNVPNVPEAGLPGHPTMAPGPNEPPLISSAAGRYFGFPAGGPTGTGCSSYYPNPGGNFPN